jgi:hypothetical protein
MLSLAILRGLTAKRTPGRRAYCPELRGWAKSHTPMVRADAYVTRAPQGAPAPRSKMMVRLPGGRVRCGCTVLLVACCLASWWTAPGNAAPFGLIMGRVIQCGGAPGYRRHCYGRTPAVIRAYDARHRLVAKEYVRSGRFSFVLRPGRVSLRIRALGTGTQRTVVVRAHKTAHVFVVIPLP